MFRNIKKNQWGGRYFQFNGPRANKSTEKNKQEHENLSSTEENDVARPTANFPIIDLKDYDIAEKIFTKYPSEPRNSKTKDNNCQGRGKPKKC